jgi:dTDP-4-dehydrorhamnose 3,5-epimerase-like enzyme
MEELIELPKILDARGNLTFLENQRQFPFDINRVYWTYDVPGGETRGGHAFQTQQEVVVALSGSFDVVVRDKNGEERRYHLNRSYKGLYLPALTWRHMENFSTNALSLHLSSGAFSENEYIRNYERFCQLD